MSQGLFDQAIRLEEEGRNEEALALWRELASTNPTRNAFLSLGRAAKDLGFTDEAERAYLQALEIDGGSALALKCLGILELHRARYQAAVGCLKRACAAEEDPGGYSLLGVALKHLGGPYEAEVAFRRANSHLAELRGGLLQSRRACRGRPAR